LAAHIDESELKERAEAKKILRDQIIIEGELIGLYEKTAKDVPNEIVKQMLRMIMHDSQKHIMMLGILVDFLDGKEVFTQDRKGLVDTLKRHLELEKESIHKGETLLNQSWLRDRKGYRTIVESWVEDERRHHKFLKELSDKPYIPISSDDFAAVFRDEDFFEERYKRSQAFWEKNREKK
jgi:rubrerythrin